jgi:hypothetical protein
VAKLLPVKTNLKLHLEIDRDLLAPYNRVAGILGISPSRYIQSYLAALVKDLMTIFSIRS